MDTDGRARHVQRKLLMVRNRVGQPKEEDSQMLYQCAFAIFSIFKLKVKNAFYFFFHIVKHNIGKLDLI